MEIGAVNTGLSVFESEIKAQQAEELYNIKLIKMAQGSEEVVGDLLQDTAEISKEAMEKYLSELK